MHPILFAFKKNKLGCFGFLNRIMFPYFQKEYKEFVQLCLEISKKMYIEADSGEAARMGAEIRVELESIFLPSGSSESLTHSERRRCELYVCSGLFYCPCPLNAKLQVKFEGSPEEIRGLTFWGCRFTIVTIDADDFLLSN